MKSGSVEPIDRQPKDTVITGSPAQFRSAPSHFQSSDRIISQIDAILADKRRVSDPIHRAFYMAVDQRVREHQCTIARLSGPVESPSRAITGVTSATQDLLHLKEMLRDLDITPQFIPTFLHPRLLTMPHLVSPLMRASLAPFWGMLRAWVTRGVVVSGFMVQRAAPDAAPRLDSLFTLVAGRVPPVVVGVAPLILKVGRAVHLLDANCGGFRFPMNERVEPALDAAIRSIASPDADPALWRGGQADALLRPALTRARDVACGALLQAAWEDGLGSVLGLLHDVMLCGRADIVLALTTAVQAHPRAAMTRPATVTAVLADVVRSTHLTLPPGVALDASRRPPPGGLGLPILDVQVAVHPAGRPGLRGLILTPQVMGRYRHCWRGLASMAAVSGRLTEAIADCRARATPPVHARPTPPRPSLATCRPWLALAGSMLSTLSTVRGRIHGAIAREYLTLAEDLSGASTLEAVVARHDAFLLTLAGPDAPVVPPLVESPLGDLLGAAVACCTAMGASTPADPTPHRDAFVAAHTSLTGSPSAALW